MNGRRKTENHSRVCVRDIEIPKEVNKKEQSRLQGGSPDMTHMVRVKQKQSIKIGQ